MNRKHWIALILALLVALVMAGTVAAGSITNLRMSNAPDGPAVADFPAGTSRVYAVFDYGSMFGETIRVRVFDREGQTVFDQIGTYTNSGTVSMPISPASGTFEDGLYTTIVYFGGGYYSQSTEWTVGGVEAPPPPAPAVPRLQVTPTDITFSMQEGSAAPRTRSVVVSTSTGTFVRWDALADVSWLELFPETGGTPSLLRVMVDPAGLPVGHYEGHITISAPGVEGSPQTIAVSLDITPLAGTETAQVTPGDGDAGWVTSAEPDRNYLGAPDIRAGLLGGAVYYGVARFDLTQVATDVQVTAAAVSFTGQSAAHLGTDGTWQLQVLDPAIDDHWVTLTFTDVQAAGSVTTVPPVQTPAGLAAGRTNFFVFAPDQLAVLQERLGGKLSLRLVGPTTGADNLFVWNSGLGDFPSTAGFKPELRISYTR